MYRCRSGNYRYHRMGAVMKIFTHFRQPGIYGTTDNGLTYRWDGTEWVPCLNIPPDDEFRISLSAEDYPGLYSQLGVS